MNVEVRALAESVLSAIPVGSDLRASFIRAAPRVQRRVRGAERSEELIEEARDIREESGTPFWHALFLAGERTETGVPTAILKSALFHQAPSEGEIIGLRLGPDTADHLAELSGGLQGRDALAVLSRVLLPSGEERYLPMLDFTSKSDLVGSAATVQAAVEVLELPGLLVSSGRSFHFYGSRLVTKEEQIDFWARALLLTPIVDERWIAHQLRAGEAALRISPNEKGNVPEVIARVP